MKLLFIFLIIPVFSVGQTVHIKDDKIVYEGKESLGEFSAEQVSSRMAKVLPAIVKGYTLDTSSATSIRATGKLQLNTPYNIIRTVTYSITVNAKTNGYGYKIDSVVFWEKERGEKGMTRSSKDVIDGISETGKVVGETEKILNETDMRFQRLIALLWSGMSSLISFNEVQF